MTFKEMSDEELEDFITSNEHNVEEETNDSYTELVHTYWDCEKCEAENEKEFRYQISISKSPGKLPFMKKSSSRSVFATDVQAGDYARYLSRPGTSDYPHEYAECIAVRHDPNLFDKTYIEWRKTNTDEKTFCVVYDSLDNVNIVRPF